jgi:hypothetical protein
MKHVTGNVAVHTVAMLSAKPAFARLKPDRRGPCRISDPACPVCHSTSPVSGYARTSDSIRFFCRQCGWHADVQTPPQPLVT